MGISGRFTGRGNAGCGGATIKLPPELGDHLTVVQGKHSYSAVVIEVKGDAIRCKVETGHGQREMTFGADGHGLNGARLRPLRKAKGVRVKGAI